MSLQATVSPSFISLPTVPHYSHISHCFTRFPFIISYPSVPSFKCLTATLRLYTSYFHVILSLPFTGKHPPVTITLAPAPTFPSVKLSFLVHSFICTYSFSLSLYHEIHFSMLVYQPPLFYCKCASSRIPHSHSSLILPSNSSSLLSTRYG